VAAKVLEEQAARHSRRPSLHLGGLDGRGPHRPTPSLVLGGALVWVGGLVMQFGTR